jgi:hypothetical protein
MNLLPPSSGYSFPKIEVIVTNSAVRNGTLIQNAILCQNWQNAYEKISVENCSAAVTNLKKP